MLNTITLMGRITQNPEIQKTAGGISYIKFCVACDRDFAGKGAERKTDFINCSAWRATAEFIGRNFEKGSPICVTGRLEIDVWEDRDGNKRRDAVVNVNNAYFAGGKKTQASAPVDVYGDDNPFVDDGDDCPFVMDDDDQLPL